MAYQPIPTKNEDDVFVNSDPLVPIAGIRQDANTSPVSANGDYHPFVFNDLGRLKTAGAAAQFPPVTMSISAIQATANTPVASATAFANVEEASNVLAYVSGTFVGVTCVFEGSLDSTNGTDGTWFGIQAVRTNANVVETTTGILGAAPVYAWELSVNAMAWFRVRATARTSGTQVWNFRLGSYATEPAPAIQPHTISGGVAQGTGLNTSIWNAAGWGGFLVADVASAALTATTTTATITPGSLATIGTYGMAFAIPVTVVSGTNPTLDITIQESPDNGTNWVDLYQFPRITAVGIYTTPIIKPSWGTRFRYVQTVGGTSPSFTRSINRIQHSQTGVILRNFVDRTIAPNTVNSTTPVWNVEGTKVVQLIVQMGAITTTAPTFVVEGSEDGTNFYSLPGATYTPTASSYDGIYIVNVLPKFVRVRVSAAGTGATLTSLNLKAMED